jgi:hypothetical protein
MTDWRLVVLLNAMQLGSRRAEHKAGGTVDAAERVHELVAITLASYSWHHPTLVGAHAAQEVATLGL